MDLITITNSKGDKFEVEAKTMDNILSAEFIIQKPFKEFEGTPDEYINSVTEKLGEPKFPEIGKEGIVLGWLLFNGVRQFGIEYLRKVLEEEDAIDSIIYMLVAQSEALTDKSKEDTEGFETSDSIIQEEGE